MGVFKKKRKKNKTYKNKLVDGFGEKKEERKNRTCRNKLVNEFTK